MTGHLTDAEREALTCDCEIMEDDPDWAETFCPFHADRMHLEVGGPASALVATVEQIVRRQRVEAATEALTETAKAWQINGWADVLLPWPKAPANPAIALSNRVLDWLRDRADREARP